MMKKILFSALCICHAIATVIAHEQYENTGYLPSYTHDLNFNDSILQTDLGIQFDDFLGDGSPSESDFDPEADEEADEIKEKAFKDFDSLPDDSETIDDQAEFAIDIHILPNAIVNGCVNVLNGEYQESTVDFSLPGATPLNFQRFYCGSGSRKYYFLSGWQLNHGAKLYHGKKTKHKHKAAILLGTNRHGVMYQEDVFGLYSCPDNFFKKRITNTGLGEINAANNFKNDILVKNPQAFDLRTSDRTHYHFRKYLYDPETKKENTVYLLDNISLPTGNSFVYKYGHTFGMPITIASFNKEGIETGGFKLTKLLRNEFETNPEITYLTSSNETIKYRFKLYSDCDKTRAILSEVIPPHSPKINYSYEIVNHHVKQRRLIKRELPDHRVLEIAYDKDGKVKELLSPSGDGSQLIATHTFRYFKRGMSGKDRITQVNTPLGEVKCYFSNTHSRRLDAISTWDKKHKLIFKERFRWGDSKNNKNHLTARILEEGTGELIAYQRYQYDPYGNISCLSLYGNHTGENKEPTYVDNLMHPPKEDSCEVHKTHYSYDLGHRRITEDDGRILNKYSYINSTNQLSAHSVIYDSRVQIRHFYRYDASGAICEEITDDGSVDNEVDNLTDVSERLIKEIKNTLTGLPEVVEEYAFDLSRGQKQLIRKTINQYDRHGWMIAQSIYDCNDKLAFSLSWKHDSHGNVIYEKDALGNETLSKYDANNNLIYEQKPDLAPRFLTYDFMNRLIFDEQKSSTSKSFQKSYRYDAMGNCIQSTDLYGNVTRNKYDALGRLIKTSYPSHDNTQPTTTIKYKRNGLGLATSITNGNQDTTLIEYNVRGKPIFTLYPDGSVEKQTYTLWGDLAESTAKDGSKIRISYDPQGRETKKEWLNSSGKIIKTTSKTYNAFHLIGEQDAKGKVTHYTYDCTGKLISEKFGKKRIYYGYDALGRKTATTKFKGNKTSVTFVEIFDALERVVESYKVDHKGEIRDRAVMSYDSQGNEIRHQEWNQAGKKITTSIYDPFGRVVERNRSSWKYHLYDLLHGIDSKDRSDRSTWNQNCHDIQSIWTSYP